MDPEMQMLAEIASIESVTRWLTAARVMEEVPEEWGPAEYGPRGHGYRSEDEGEVRSLDEKRAIAERARQRAVGA